MKQNVGWQIFDSSLSSVHPKIFEYVKNKDVIFFWEFEAKIPKQLQIKFKNVIFLLKEHWLICIEMLNEVQRVEFIHKMETRFSSLLIIINSLFFLQHCYIKMKVLPFYKMNLSKYIQDIHNIIILFSWSGFQVESVQPFLSDGLCSNCKRC